MDQFLKFAPAIPAVLGILTALTSVKQIRELRLARLNRRRLERPSAREVASRQAETSAIHFESRFNIPA